ncbi:hypothetical protein E3P86_03811, partial [Wallemia ichthyophaga]
MTTAGTLYSQPNNFRAIRCLSVAEYNGLKLDTPEFALGTSNKTPEFLSKFPFGKAPAFESADKKFHLSQTAAISWYLASLNDSTGLLGKSPQDAGLIQQWIAYGDTDLFIPVSQPAYMVFGLTPVNHAQYQAALPQIERAFAVL